MSSTPLREPPAPHSCSESSPCWTPEEAYTTESEGNEVTKGYNSAIDKIANLINPSVTRSSLYSQLNVPFRSLRKNDQVAIVKKATEDCLLVCKVIAPDDGEELFHSLTCSSDREDDVSIPDDLVVLMTAYKNAGTRALKRQILRLYVYRYPATTLKKIHEPYENLSTWEIKQARLHARSSGPGTLPINKKLPHVRLDMAKVDHFVEFVNRPYFYQDMSFGSKILTLDSSEKVEMPNVVRTVTRATMVSQYFEYCKEQEYNPLSRTTLFKILEVRDASQRTSLQGLDNAAADGASAFQTLETIADVLEKGGMDKEWYLRDSKRYLKTEYRVHCKDFESTCADHQQHLIYDFECPQNDIFQWKAHILRSIHQDQAKQDLLKQKDLNTALLVMDWAMKFLQLKYQEKQSDWFGKRGLSWHVSTIISVNGNSGDLEIRTYAHLLDTCKQDWFAVLSIIEDTLKRLKCEQPQIKKVQLRSDEAGTTTII